MIRFKIRVVLVLAYHSFTCFFMKLFFQFFGAFEFSLVFYLKMNLHFALISYFIGSSIKLGPLFELFFFSLFSRSLCQFVQSIFVSFSKFLSIFFFPFTFTQKFKITIQFEFSFLFEQEWYLLHHFPNLLLQFQLYLFDLKIKF